MVWQQTNKSVVCMVAAQNFDWWNKIIVPNLCMSTHAKLP